MAKKHIIIYLNALDLPLSSDFKVFSEISGAVANDIHHICNREDKIENLMAVTREEHIDWGEKKHLIYDLLVLHRTWLDVKGIKYSKMWFDEQMARWEPERHYDK